MLDLFNPRPPPRALLSVGRVLPLLLTVVAMYFLEASTQVDLPAASPRGDTTTPRPERRLVVFWVDALSTTDMDQAGVLPRLKARLALGLHGPVRECMDALSVPCVTAATTGVDRFSFFALARNFGGSSGVAPGSLFHAIQALGVRVGFIGDAEVSSAFTGFDWLEIQREVDDRRTVARGLAALDDERLGLVVIHLRLPDELSHKVGPASPAYADALEVVDREIDAAFPRLRPTDHVVIFGDHGHTADGQHFAGLDVPSYAAFFGPLFARPLARPMAITDHASLWAPVFGLRFGQVPWVEAYFAGEPVPPQIELPPVASGNASLPLWAALVGVLFAVVISVPHRIRWLGNPEWRGLLLLLLGLAAVAFASGLAFMDLRPALYYHNRGVNTLIGLACGLLGLALAWPARRIVRFVGDVPPATGLAALFMGGAAALAVPTVYKFGGVFTGLTGLIVAIAVAGVLAINARLYRRAGLCGLLIVLVFLVWNPAVRNFAVRWFPYFAEVPAEVRWPLTLSLAAIALGLSAGPQWRLWALGAGAGLAFAALAPLGPPRIFIAPCVALFPLVWGAHRRPALGPLVAFVAPAALAFFFGYDPARLGPVVCALAAFPVWARARATAPALERGIALVLLLWLTLWTTLGCRIGGLDFQYFFHWLPEGASVEATWGRNTLLTTSLYLSVPMLGMLLADRPGRAGGVAIGTTLPVAWHFARLKLGLVLLFIVGFSMRSVDAGPFITADVLMEAGVWVMLLAIMAPLPFVDARSTPRS